MIDAINARDVKGWRWNHFSASEMACTCCGAVRVDEALLDKLERLRDAVGFPLTLSSAFRCEAHNAAVSATGAAGPHTTGKAADIRAAGAQAFNILRAALALGFTGIGLSQKGAHAARFVHVDILENGPGCPRPSCWSY